MKSQVKRSVVIDGHKTSFSLEEATRIAAMAAGVVATGPGA
jgi:predicted DNA-binding ribbon-helix-helix protein